MTLIRDLLARPEVLSATSKYTIANGVIYLVGGALLVVWPGATQVLLRDPAFVGHEAGLVRVMAMSVMIIGWFYTAGGRTGGRQVPAASVFDRLLLVPAVLVPLAFAGVFPHLLLAFAFLDVALGIGAWVLISRSAKTA